MVLRGALSSCVMMVSALSNAWAEPVDVEAVVSRVRVAVGYGAIAAHAPGIEAKGTASMGGLEGAYTLLFSGDRACIQRTQGRISTSSAIDGDLVWITDIGGEVRRVVNKDREEQLLSLLIMNHGAFGEASPLVFEAAPEGSGAALAFRLKDGRVRGTLALDEATGLPREWAFGVGEKVTRVTLGDYIDFGGVKVPRTVKTLSPAGTTAEVRIEQVGEPPVFFRSPYEMIGGAPGAVFDPALPAALEVARAPTGHLLVHPRVNGKDVGWFIFDTGAGSMILSTPVAAELGVETFGTVPATGVGGQTSAAFCRPASVVLGPMTMDEPLMVTIDLSFLDQHMGRRVAGLVGYNLLARCVARIDMDTPSIELHDPSVFDGKGMEWGELIVDARLPHVRATFEGHEGLFRLDTGAAQMSVSMHAPAVRELAMLEGRETTDALAGGVGGTVAVKRGELAWFELGGRRTERVMAEFAMEDKGVFGDAYTAGNIGGVLLRPFVLVMDYPRGRIAFVAKE